MAWKFMGKRWVFLFGAVLLVPSSHAMAASVSYAEGDGTSTTATGSLLAASVSTESTATGPVLFSAGGPVTLTGGSTTNVAPQTGAAGDGRPDVIYDPSTGDIKIVADGRNLINTFSFFENVGQPGIFTGSAPNFPGTSAAVTSDFDDEITRSGFTPPFDSTTVWDLGNVAQTGLTDSFLKQALNLNGNTQAGSNQPGPFNYDLIVTGVPEPTSIGLLGLGAIGLLARRRRIAKRA